MTSTSTLTSTDTARQQQPVSRPARLLSYFCLAGSLGALLYMMWPTFKAPFGIIDDHEIVYIIGERPRLPASEVISTVLTWTNEANGRFRPVYWIGRALECATAGQNSTWWHIDRFLLAAVTLTAIYATAARFMSPLMAAPISLLPFLGAQFETWYRLGPNEAYAMPLLVVGLALLVHGMSHDHRPWRLWPALVFLGLSGLAKENFAAVTLVVVIWIVYHFGLADLTRRDRWVLGAAIVASVLDLAAVLAKVAQHGGVYPQVRSAATIQNWTAMAIGSLSQFAVMEVGISLAAYLLVLARGRGPAARTTLEIGGLAVGLIATQAVFYAGGPPMGRYLYPLALLPVLMWGVVGTLCRTPDSRLIRHTTVAVVAMVLLVLMVRGSGATRAASEQSVADSVAFSQALAAIEHQATRERATTVVLQPWEPASDIERVLSLSRFITAQTDLKVTTLPATHATHEFSQQLGAELQEWAESGMDNLQPYTEPRRCLSIVFGENEPVCSTSAPAPGDLLLAAFVG